jgi:hypothetical protein
MEGSESRCGSISVQILRDLDPGGRKNIRLRIHNPAKIILLSASAPQGSLVIKFINSLGVTIFKRVLCRKIPRVA